jgi:uncharacterized coiled-coil DUF342 family protein
MGSKLDIWKDWKVEIEPKVSELKKRVDELTEQGEAIPVKIKFLEIFGEDYKSLILDLITEGEEIVEKLDNASTEYELWKNLLFRLSDEIDLCMSRQQ